MSVVRPAIIFSCASDLGPRRSAIVQAFSDIYAASMNIFWEVFASVNRRGSAPPLLINRTLRPTKSPTLLKPDADEALGTRLLCSVDPHVI
ncbi:hypothetical protein EVAR_71525_1 [Eumeta japonica]|uniref:Uncharacterized protein n=1 Tax=Eumeta variegata TaxID=151549 RepID=A0A4C1TCQ0_EUMVA|nr:hypothetical protein EVAR_71525_1 [Eumeta japonica]